MKEVPISAEVFAKAVAGLGPDAVLVGGQALAMWVEYYQIDALVHDPIGGISEDADFLGTRDDLTSIAAATNGNPRFPARHEITALIGQVFVPARCGEFINIDVLHRVVGLKAEDVRRNSETMVWGDAEFRIMHPLDVLVSRLENMRQLEQKRNEEGVMQARLAILVVHAHILACLTEQSERAALNLIERVASIAKSAAGRLAAREFVISFVSAIPNGDVKSETFQKIRWPRMLKEFREASARSAGGVADVERVKATDDMKASGSAPDMIDAPGRSANSTELK